MESPESKSTDTPPALPTKVVVPHAGDNKTKKAPVLSPEEIAAMRTSFNDHAPRIRVTRETIEVQSQEPKLVN